MIIGIDLGTTNSIVTYFKNNETHIIKNEFGHDKTPSIVSFDDDGTYYVGDIAKERLLTHANTTFSVFKRSLGKDLSYEAFKRTKVSPLDLSSMVIKYLVKQAEAVLDEEITEAVISVPAYFTDVQRHETKMAGIMAGLKVERIINEPSAAALAYYHKYQNDGYNLVFDFGGGTLDISIVDIFDDIIDVIAVVGDMECGGVDIDRFLANDFIKRHSLEDKLSTDEKRDILYRAEKVKIALNTSNHVDFSYTYKNQEYISTYSNELLTEICKTLLEKIKNLISAIMMDAKIDPESLESIICVGGSSNVLFIRQYLEYLLDIKPTISLDTDLVVALGVGIFSAIKDRNPEVKDMLITDVCPFSIGVQMIHDAFGVVIPKNSVLPMVRQQYFVTTEDYQKQIRFQIYQGDNIKASLNDPIGDAELLSVESQPKGMAGANVKIAYDINGIINVSYKSSLESKEKVLITNPNLDPEEVKRKIQSLKKMNEKSVSNPHLEKVLFRYNALVRNADMELEEKLKASFSKFNDILDTNKPSLIKRACVEFELYLNQFSTLNKKDKDFEFKFEDDDSLLN